MNRRRSAWVSGLGVAVLVGLGVHREAQAAIPYEAEITPGQLRGIAHAPGDPWLYGYWEYLPSNFDEFGPGTAPLLVFLPGIGEYDDVSSCPGGADVCVPSDCGGDGLCRNLTWGPQMLMDDGLWDDATRPFIMVSPQHPVPPFTSGQWNVDMLDDYIQFVIDNYPVDPRRMYLIGMSQGGRAVLQYTQAYPRRFAAVAPTPGGTVDADASCFFQDTALWVFHGEDDADGNLGPGVFSPCTMVNVAYQYENPGLYVGSPQCLSIAGEPRPTGRLTMYYNVAHFSWVPTVDPIGNGFAANEWASDQGCNIPATFRQYSAALDSDGVYSWFLSLDRPRVVAPDDLLIDVPETALVATITDDDAVTIEWTQTGGPAATLNNADTDTLDVSDLQPSQQYTFQVYVLDADNQWDLDEVVVTTEAVFSEGSSSSGMGSSTGAAGETTGAAESSGGVLASTGAAGSSGAEGGSLTGTGSSAGAGGTSSGDALDDTQGGPPGEGSAGNVTTAGPGTGMTGDSGDTTPATDGATGCNCSSDPGRSGRSGGWLAWSLMLLGVARRRRSGVGRVRATR